jgi:hypothetical protein
MLRRYLHAMRTRRAAAAADALALQVGPHIARDIGLDYPADQPVRICLNPII